MHTAIHPTRPDVLLGLCGPVPLAHRAPGHVLGQPAQSPLPGRPSPPHGHNADGGTPPASAGWPRGQRAARPPGHKPSQPGRPPPPSTRTPRCPPRRPGHRAGHRSAPRSRQRGGRRSPGRDAWLALTHQASAATSAATRPLPPPGSASRAHNNVAFCPRLIADELTSAGKPPPARKVPLAPERPEAPTGLIRSNREAQQAASGSRSRPRTGSTYSTPTPPHPGEPPAKPASATVISPTLQRGNTLDGST